MARSSISKLARGITWGIFLFVSLTTAGLSLVPEAERDFPGIFQAALLFSGVPVVAVAEFHIQRYELFPTRSSLVLFLVLIALPFTYFYMSAGAAHSEIGTGWLLLGGWFLVFVGLISLLSHTKLDGHLLAGLCAFLGAGCALILVLCIWLWPKIYYDYLRQTGHLEWTPYFMAAVGLLFWVLLVEVSRRLRSAVQQVAQADAG